MLLNRSNKILTMLINRSNYIFIIFLKEEKSKSESYSKSPEYNFPLEMKGVSATLQRGSYTIHPQGDDNIHV